MHRQTVLCQIWLQAGKISLLAEKMVLPHAGTERLIIRKVMSRRSPIYDCTRTQIWADYQNGLALQVVYQELEKIGGFDVQSVNPAHNRHDAAQTTAG